jgi:predicted Rossmann fold flavoprotein
VTNSVVSEKDFWGGRRPIIRKVLRAFPADATVRFFRELGVSLHEEADGKLFPDSNRARDVLNALLGGLESCGARLVAPARVHGVTAVDGGFSLETSRGRIAAAAVVLATGGLSLPKSGSDGAGYGFAAAVGHSIVPTTPALAPLVLDAQSPAAINGDISGVAIDVELRIWIDGAVATELRGALLWTHFGVSGPVVLNASRHWARARLDGRDVRATINLCPGEDFDGVDARLRAAAVTHPRSTVRSQLARVVPESLASALLRALRVDPDRALAHLPRDVRRGLVRAIVEWPLAVVDTRGYNYAEVTAGGVALTEIDSATMQSRVRPRLFLVGEILDVDGRIGGFNFQWAWATGQIAGRALPAILRAGE